MLWIGKQKIPKAVKLIKNRGGGGSFSIGRLGMEPLPYGRGRITATGGRSRKRRCRRGCRTPIGNHSFQATGITAYLANGGTLAHAQSCRKGFTMELRHFG